MSGKVSEGDRLARALASVGVDVEQRAAAVLEPTVPGSDDVPRGTTPAVPPGGGGEALPPGDNTVDFESEEPAPPVPRAEGIEDTHGCNPKRNGAEPRVFTREFKIYCASVFLTNGNAKQSAELCKVDPRTFQKWTTLKWWPEAMREARQKYEAEITAGFSEAIRLAQAGIIDRIKFGDTKITKDGDEIRVPVGAKDLAVIQAIAFDKRQIISGAPTSISRRSASQTPESQAAKLRARAKTKKGRIDQRQAVVAAVSGNVVPFEKKA